MWKKLIDGYCSYGLILAIGFALGLRHKTYEIVYEIAYQVVQ